MRSRMTAPALAALRCWVPIGLGLVLALACTVHSETPASRPAPALEEMRQLVLQLGHENYNIREQATDSLLVIGEPALPLLENATESKDPEVRQRSWRIIDQHAANGNVAALLFQLSCSNAPIRASAAESLGKLEGKATDALPCLIKATSDQTEYVRCSAKDAVKKIQATLPIKIEVKHNAESIDLNGETFFRIEVSNQGKEATPNLCISAMVPDQMKVTSVQGPIKHHRSGRQVTCEPFTLEANETRFCEIHVLAQRPGTAQLKVEVSASGLAAPILGEASVAINANAGQ